MKKTLRLLSHFIPFLGLFALWAFMPFSFSASPAFFIHYAICLILCPFLGLLRLPNFCRGLLGGLSVFAFSCGIPGAMAPGGTFVAHAVLAVGCVSLGTLLVYFSLPKDTAEEAHLQLRGMPPRRARKTLLLRESFAFFFEKSGILAAAITVWLLFISDAVSPALLWSGAVLTAVFAFLGFLLYLLLGAPSPAVMRALPSKSRYIVISLLAFILILIAVYVYVGFAYTAPEPALSAALAAVQTVLTPALIASAVGFLLGMLFGYLLSFCGARFFAMLCRGVLFIPAALLASILSLLLPQLTVAIAVPLLFMGTLGMLQSRLSIRPYKGLPMSGQKKAVRLPLFHMANLALLPYLVLNGLFAAVFIDVTSLGVLSALGELSFMFASSILVIIAGILYILCLLTKEVRYHG